MSLFDDFDVFTRLVQSFPQLFINRKYEIIIYPKRNTYFRLQDVKNERDLQAKILEWLSREVAKSADVRSRQYHLDGINRFLGTNFTQDQMYVIYTYLGNAIDHVRTLRFIDSGFNLNIFCEEEQP